MPIKSKELFTISAKAQKEIQIALTASTFNTLLTNRVPIAIADKLSRQVTENIDLVEIYKIIMRDIPEQKVPKQRVLDRTIVHMFEILYKIIYLHETKQNKARQKEFFALVPRGECLDLFLQLVKEYCMGDAEIERYTYKIEPLIEEYRSEDIINWNDLYKSNEFKIYLSGLLNLILTHLRKDQKPIPALENKIPIRYQPYRINLFLNQICKLRQTGKLNLNLS